MGDAARASFEKRFEIGFAARHLTEQLVSLLDHRPAHAR
jgi:hypothetical protein